MSKVMTMEERAQYQQRDIDWLLQIPFLTEQVKTGDSKKEQKDAAEELTRLTENYGILRQNATNLSSSHQALDAMLADSENGLVMQVSGNMLTGKGKLTPEEQSAINMLAGLGNRIAANPDVLKDKGLTLVVTDIITDTDDTDQSMTTVKITEDLIQRIENSDIPPAVKSSIKSGLENLRLSLENPMSAWWIDSVIANADATPEIMSGDKISVKKLMTYLHKKGRLQEKQRIDIFALAKINWNMDANDRQEIANLIVFLAGDMVHVITPIETEGRRQTYLKIQA